MTWKASPTAEAKELAGGAFAKFSLDGIFHLDPAKSPKTIDLTILGAGARTPLGTPAPDRAFRGAALRLVLHALSTVPATREELNEIRKLLAQGGQGGKKGRKRKA